MMLVLARPLALAQLWSPSFGSAGSVWLQCGAVYHACNGVRHLFWDAVVGLNIPAIYKSGQVALGVAFVLSALFWAVLYV